jgi:hypothetical protein
VSTTTDGPKVRPRSRRLPIAPLVFLLVLAIAALGVWWKVFGDDAERKERAEAACEDAEEAPPALDPATISLRVLNATETAGLAQQVAAQLQSFGFRVDEILNDDTGREVTGAGELRYGRRGTEVARYVAVYVPGAGDWIDTRATEQVDVVLGPEFGGLRPAEEVTTLLDSASEAVDECGSGAA